MKDSFPPDSPSGLSSPANSVEHDAERNRLDMEKATLEAEKLRAELADAKRAPQRATIATITPIAAVMATLIIGWATYVLNASINHASEEQRAFENYNKLTESFAKGGTSRVASVIGLRRFVAADDDRAPQTAAILANDLLEEQDPLVVHAISETFRTSNLSTFEQLREVHAAARSRFEKDEGRYIINKASATYAMRRSREKSLTWNSFLGEWTGASMEAANAELASNAAYDIYDHRLLQPDEDWESMLNDFMRYQQTEADPHAVESTFLEWLHSLAPEGRPDIQKHFWRSVHDARAFVVTSDVVRAMLDNASMVPEGLDARRVVLYRVHWSDQTFRRINLSESYLFGDALGTDFSNADLTQAHLALDVGASRKNVTSFCGSILWGTEFGDRVRSHPLPDFSASDWWDARGLSKALLLKLEKAYPRAVQERDMQLPPDQLTRLCAERHHASARSESRPLP